MQLLRGQVWSWLHEWRLQQQLSVPVSELESGFPGRLWTFGAEGGYWGWTRTPSCLHCVTGTCCKYIPLWNSITRLTRGKTNCYRRESLHLNPTTSNQLKGKCCRLRIRRGCELCLSDCWKWFKVELKGQEASGARRHFICFGRASAEVTGRCSIDPVRGFLSSCCYSELSKCCNNIRL